MVLLYDLEMADLSRRCHLIAYVQEEALESSTHNFQTFIFAETGGCRYCEQLWCNLTHWMHKLMLNEDTLHGWSLFQTGVVEAACSSPHFASSSRRRSQQSSISRAAWWTPSLTKSSVTNLEGASAQLESVGTLAYHGVNWPSHSKAKVATKIFFAMPPDEQQEINVSRTALLSVYITTELGRRGNQIRKAQKSAKNSDS